eukprot:gnl/Chilomastix_cuspidata/3121.p1 GENE.gnl/Chilomastix_cuspidata/3121~~gnl/Chilomastix_cuspidata/3121.p1  ORF type:complete len:372 (+),score=216.77 gnl/Chilomastix_cuspidata/3121:387-1502(+)
MDTPDASPSPMSARPSSSAEDSDRAFDLHTPSGERLDMVDADRLQEFYEKGLEENQELKAVNQQLANEVLILLQSRRVQTRIGQFKDQSSTVRVAEINPKYQQALDEIEQAREDLAARQEELDGEIDRLKEQFDGIHLEARQAGEAFFEFRKLVLGRAKSSTSGKPVPQSVADRLLAQTKDLEAELHAAQLKYITASERLRMARSKMDAKGGDRSLHYIDYEQRRIENQTLAEKIEDRSEELLKLRRKIVDTIQVIAHMREKLQFVLTGTQHLRKELADTDEQLGAFRDTLAQLKRDKMNVRAQIEEHKRRTGLVGNPALMDDYRRKQDSFEELTEHRRRLQEEHATIMRKVAQYEALLHTRQQAARDEFE